jgi:plastocyanin
MLDMRHLTLIVLAVALVTALGACRSGELAVSPSVDAAAPSTVTLADFSINPTSLEAVSSGVVLEVANDGPTPHNLTVRNDAGEVLMATADLRRDQAETISAELPAGEYVIFCSLAGHESLGMRGSLTITAP